MNSIGSLLAENGSYRALVIESVIALVLVFPQSFKNHSKRNVLTHS